jgi:predicted RNA methylase
MAGFRQAISHVVKPGAQVLELGGGTSVLSFFAAQHAAKVWCVEKNPELVREARRLLSLNPHGDRVEVVEADALEYLPPEPVDVVICEMIHVAMLREKQIPVLDSFKRRYLARFGGPLPVFVPEALIQAVQPVEQSFNFEGYFAPTLLFQHPNGQHAGTRHLADPVVYQSLRYEEELPALCRWDGITTVQHAGELNALRFITKNVLAILLESESTIDWHSQYMVVPLENPLPVSAGDQIRIRFAYQPGAAFTELRPEIFRI